MSKIRQKLFAAALAVLLLVSGLGFTGCLNQVEAKSAGEMKVHFLDVGQGLSILAQSEGQTLLYDGGARSASSSVVSYLKEQKIKKIDYLISSHYDEDHVSGLIGCLNAFDVERVIGADYVHDSKLYRSFMEGVEAQGLEVEHPEVGSSFSFGSGSFTVLAPAHNSNNSNANSVVIKLENGENSFIFTGDAEHESEAEMVKSGLDLECDVLSVGHHGSASSTSWDFLGAAVPEFAVISCGAGNQYGHPDADTMEKLSSMEIEVFRTDKQGTIVGVSDGKEISWNMEPCNDYTPGDEDDMGTQPGSAGETYEESQGVTAWLSATGTKYHSVPDCGTMNPDEAVRTTVEQAEADGYEACKRCW